MPALSSVPSSRTRPTCACTSRWRPFPSRSAATGPATPAASRPPPPRTNCAARWPTCCPPRRSRCRCTRAATRSWRRWTGWCASARGGPGCAAGWRWRSWRSSCRRPVLDAVLPPVVRRQAAADYERWRERNPDARPWIRTAVWQVPVRWFVLVLGRGARVRQGPARRAVLRYRTPMVQARRRVARALRTLRESDRRGAADRRPGGRGALAGGVPSALAGRAGLRRPGARAARRRSWRRTARPRMWPRGSRRCGPGTGTGAGEAYGRLVERWRAVRDRRSAN